MLTITSERLERIRAKLGALPSDPEERDKYLRTNSRLYMPAEKRIPIAAAASSCFGVGLGFSRGSKMAGLRFRAEHAHKLPTDASGWWLYHRAKNYQSAVGGLKEGLKMVPKVCVWATLMIVLEDMFDVYRGTLDLFNTTLATVTVAGGFSLWNRFSLPMMAKSTKSAILIGLVYGGLQDAAALARGRHLGYVDFIRRKFRGSQGDASDATTS